MKVKRTSCTGTRVPSSKPRWKRTSARLVAMAVLALGTEGARADFALSWLTQYGTSGLDQGQGIAVDSSGQSWVAGYTTGSFDVANAGVFDMILSRISPTGSVDFTRQRGGPDVEEALGVAFVGSGTVFTGGLAATTAFDGQANIGGFDPVMLRYDTTGTWQGTTRFGSSADDVINGLAGNAIHLLTVGSTPGSFEGQTNAGGGNDAFVSKRTSTGALVWTRFVGTSSSDSGFGAAFDNVGNAYLAGQTSGTLPGNSSAGSNDAFVARFDASGNRTLLKQFGSSGTEFAHAVKIDISGNIYLAGGTDGALDGQVNAGGISDAFLTKLDSAGNVLWTRLFGGSLIDQAVTLDIDSIGNVWIGGLSSSSFGGHTNAGGNDAFVAEYDSNGNLLDKAFIAGSQPDQINGLAIGADDSVYVTGSTRSALNGPNAGGGNDIFVAKIAAVPEPSTWAFLSAGAASLFAFRRRARD